MNTVAPPSMPTLLARALVALAATTLMSAALAQPAQPVTTPPAAAATATDDTLYRKLGGQPGLVRLMDDFVPRLVADTRMRPFFKDVDHVHLKAQLIAQFCEVSGGPCRLKGPDMKKAHAGFDIDKADFNALVEVLQVSMDAQGIAFPDQNRLLAKLAPMHRDIINTP